jgi:hypothetical protein
MRTVEYYRLWPGNGGDSGSWDTAFIQIPRGIPEDKYLDFIQEEMTAVCWEDEPPVAVGLYCLGEEEEEEPCVGCVAGCGIRIAVDRPGADKLEEGWVAIERCDSCDKYDSDWSAAQVVCHKSEGVLLSGNTFVAGKLYPKLAAWVEELGPYRALETWLAGEGLFDGDKDD